MSAPAIKKQSKPIIGDLSAPKMSHTQLLDSIIQKKSKKTTLPFLQELLSINDPVVRKKKAHQMLKNYATVGHNGFDVVKKHVFNWCDCTTTSHIHCIFGEFVNWGSGTKGISKNWNDGSLETFLYKEQGNYYGKPLCGHVKNGIEILSAQPNATGSTYSNKCQITVKELKEACKANGIKATGDKKALLRTLMKI
jgi:hypothetical protein